MLVPLATWRLTFVQAVTERDVAYHQHYPLLPVQVGWFLHTPFPSSEIYRTLPVREDVLRATLRADLIGFHTYDYARHFISSCTRILGLEGTPEGVEDNGRCAASHHAVVNWV